MAVFASGTKTIIVGTNAPPGWTKETVFYHNHALRIVNGSTGGQSAGSVDFTSVYTSQSISLDFPYTTGTGATVLTAPVLPTHIHSLNSGSPSTRAYAPGGRSAPYSSGGGVTSSFGGPGASGHSHPVGAATGTASGSINFGVKYVDVIVVTKD